MDGKGTGLGVIFRNEFGEVKAAATKFLPICVEVHIAEALVFRWAIESAAYLMLNPVVFESDCLRLVSAWSSRNSNSNSYFAGIIKDCAVLLSNSSFKVLTHMNRSANRAADGAKLAFLAFESYWIGDVPPQIGDFVQDGVRPDGHFSFFIYSSRTSKKKKGYIKIK